MKVLEKLFAIILINQLAGASLPPVPQCNTAQCTYPRGYIEFFERNPNTRWTISASDFTTFVVIIRDIETTSNAPWGTLTQKSRVLSKPHDLDKENRLFTFKNTRQVILSLQNLNIEYFHLEYYMGCHIFEDRNITIYKKPSLPSENDNGIEALLDKASDFTCWFVVPTITEEQHEMGLSTSGLPTITTTHINVDVQQTYLNVKVTSVNENTAINVYDACGGSTIMSLQGSTTFSVENLPKNDSTHFQYQRHDQQQIQISTLLFIDLTCQSPQGCDEAGFMFSSYALRQSDLDCIERNNKCRFNIGLKTFICTNKDSFFVSLLDPAFLVDNADEDSFQIQECPAFQNYFTSIYIEVNVVNQVEEHPDGRSGALTSRVFGCSLSQICRMPNCFVYT